MKKVMKAMKGSVVIESLADDKKTPSGIIIPGGHAEKSMMGRVTDSSLEDINIGDIILTGRYSGKEVKLTEIEVDCRVINGDDIMAITDGTLNKISPVSDFILAEVIEDNKTTASGIYTGNETQGKRDILSKAKVISIGPGRVLKDSNKLHATTTIKDQTIFYGPFVTYGLKKFGKNLIMIRESDVEMVGS